MAVMYPQFGPKINDSSIAEPLVYEFLKQSLDDNFHVIHSIPWLSSVVDEFRGDVKSPIGEIDFLVFHAFYGVLAIEVKGGAIKHNYNGFYYSQSKQKTNPDGQLRRGTFAIQNWFRAKGRPLSIGHSYFFPESEAQLNDLPPGVVDWSHNPPVKLVIDINDIGKIEKRITEIMDYFRKQLSVTQFKDGEILHLISMIVPEKDYSPCWYARIQNDDRMWLRLTREQAECIDLATQKNKFLVSGWPGSGKTIVAIQTARNLSKAKFNVLFITFNRLIASKIVEELAGFEGISVHTFHSLCRSAAELIGVEGNSQQWLKEGAYTTLEQACEFSFFEKYDALIVDEGQAIRDIGWKTLSSAFANKKMLIMFDVAQAFSYEQPSTKEQLESFVSAKTFLLTQSLRIPKVICDRLKLFNFPEYSVTNPRSEEIDALNEIVSHSQEQCLNQCILKLRADNIPYDWITVLKPSTMSVPSHLVPQGIRVESIGRYRGMESPIIIIFAASNMSDTEFFCAYSRATSRCIVILDAFDLKQDAYASLGKQIYIEQKQIIETELIKSYTTTMIANSTLTFEEAVNGRIYLQWCKEWKAYTLKGEFSESVRLLAVDHFSRIKTPMIYTWIDSSRDCLEIISQYDTGYPVKVTLGFCQYCGGLTPHVMSSFDFSRYIFNENFYESAINFSGKNCVSCRTLINSRDVDFEKYCVSINNILDNHRLYSEAERRELDPYVFSIGVLLKHGVRHHQRLFVELIGSASALGRVAIVLSIFIVYRDYIKKGLFEFRMVDVASASHSFNDNLINLSFSQWQGYINGAFANLEKFNVVVSTKKGYRKVNKDIFNEIIRTSRH